PLLLSAHCSTHHPPLHSFPTRRSSDLHTTHSQSSRFPSFFDCFRFLSSFWSLFIYPSIYIPLQRKGKKKKNLCGIYIYILFLSQFSSLQQMYLFHLLHLDTSCMLR